MTVHDRAVREVVSSTTFFTVIGAGIVGHVALENGFPGSSEIFMMMGYALFAVAVVLAVAHRNVVSAVQHHMWYAAIACTWVASAFVAMGVERQAPHPVAILYGAVGLVLLMGATALRAFRPRDRMLEGICRSERLWVRAEQHKKQLRLKL